MRALLSLLTLVSTVGCGSAAYTYSGYWASDHFPLGDDWVWEYSSEAEDFLLQVETTNRETSGGIEVVTLDYTHRDTGNLLYSIKWSSNNSDGIQIHGYYTAEPFSGQDDDDGGDDDTGSATDASIGEWVLFNPPVEVLGGQAKPGDALTTTTGGVTYEASFDTYEDCPNLYVSDWRCMKVIITSDDDGAAPFEGTWHWAAEYGTSLFQPEGTDFPWKLVGKPERTPAN